MKKRFKIWMLCLGILMGVSFGMQEKETYASYSRYTTGRVNIRKKATTNSDVVGQYKKGTKVTCYGTSGNWTKVKYNGYYRYVSTKYLSVNAPAYTRYVKARVNIRKKATTNSDVVGQYKKGAKITCYGTTGNWTKVKYNGYYRYVSTKYLSSKVVSTVSKGQQVANYAKKFVGNPYKWGGESLTNGADCSGFTKAVYKHFGKTLPHSSISQRSCGSYVKWSNKKPGDLICYEKRNGYGHVGIYIGNNKVVHAGSSSTGIHISKANYRPVYNVRRIVK